MSINIILNLLKDLQEEKIPENYGDKTIIDLVEIINSINLNKIIFLSEIVEKKRIFNYPYISYLFFYSSEESIMKLIQMVEELIECKDKIFVNFKNLIKFLSENLIFMKIIDKIIPYYKFENQILKRNIIIWIPLFEQLYNKGYEFSIEFVDNENKNLNLMFQNTNKDVFPVFRFSEKNEELFLSSGIRINQFSEKSKKKGKPLELNYKEKKGDKEKYTFIFYQMVSLILEQSIKIPYSQWLKKVFMSINNNFTDKTINEKISSLYYKNKLFDINLLFINSENKFSYDDNNLIGNILGMFYSCSKEFLNYFYKYLNNDFSKSIIKEVQTQLTNMKNKDIKEIVNKFIDISDEINKFSIFFLYLQNRNNYKRNDDDLIILNKLNNDIIVLEKLKILLPNIKDKITEYSDLLTEEKKKVEEKIQIDNKHYSEQEAENKKYLLEGKIEDLMNKNKENYYIYDFLTTMKIKMDKTETITIEFITKMEQILEDFLLFIKKNKIEIVDNIIKFPKLNLKKVNDSDKIEEFTIEIIKECFILYSYKFKLIQKLYKLCNDKNDLIKYYKIIYKLENYKEFRDICKILYNRLLNEIKIDEKLISKIINSLNSMTIIKLIEISKKYKKKALTLSELPDYLKKIITKINSYIEYNEINNYDIILFNEISNKYKYNFKLFLPNITPNDLIFLFCKLDENEKFNQNIYYPNLCFDKFNKVEFEKFIERFNEERSHKNCMDKLIKEILDCIGIEINKNKEVNRILNDILSENVKNKKFYENLNDLYNFSLNIDNYISNIEFNIDDCKYIINKQINIPDFYNKYPILYFWLIKNQNYSNGEIFLNSYKNEKWKNILKEKNTLPFWIFCLRIYSSINYITSYNTNTDLGCTFNEKIYNQLKQSINGHKDNIGINWIYLLDCNFNKNTSNIFIKLISKFLNQIIEDKSIDTHIKDIKDIEFKTVIIEIFEKNFIEAINYSFSNENSELKQKIFNNLFDIKSSIKNQIIEKTKNLYKNDLTTENNQNKLVLELNKNKENIKKELSDLSKNFSNLLEDFRNNLLIYYEQELKNLKSEYTKILIEYNNLIEENIHNSIYEENEFVIKEINKEEKLKEIEKRLSIFHTVIIKKDFNEMIHKQIKISKYKYKINSKDKNFKIIIQIIKDREEKFLDVTKKEGFLYINEQFKNPYVFWQSNSKRVRNKLDFEFIENIVFQEKKEIFEEDKSISSCEEFEEKSKITIGDFSKKFYEDKINDIIFVCNNLYQGFILNEEKLYELINEIMNKIQGNPDFSTIDNSNLMFDQSIKFNKQTKILTEKNIKNINNNLNDIIKLIKDYRIKYEKYHNELEKINLIDEIFTRDYSLNKLEFKNINSKINLQDIKSTEFISITPIIYIQKETGKIKCNYKNLIYDCNYFIYGYHNFAILNIISALNFIVNIDLDLDEPSPYIKLENNILLPNSVNKIYLYPSPESKQKNNYTIYNFILNVKNEEDKLSINFNIKINYDKFYINLSCNEYELMFDENEKIFKFKGMEYLLWGEEINIKYICENGNIKISQKTGLVNDKDKNTANKPNIIIDENNNNMRFLIRTNKNIEETLTFIANIYFTDSFFIKILFDTKVKENKLQFLGYDYNRQKFDKNCFLYLKKDYLNFMKEFIYDQYLYISNELNKSLHYKIDIKNKLKGINLVNNEILIDTFIKENIIKLTFKINKDFAENLTKNNLIEIQCKVGDIEKTIILTISEIIDEDQVIKMGYRLEKNKLILFENQTYKNIKNNKILLYNGFIQNLNFSLDYSIHKINNQTNSNITNIIFYYNLKSKKLERINKEDFVFKDNKIEQKILICGIINELVYWYPLINHFSGKYNEWFAYYQSKQFDNYLDIIIKSYDNNYNKLKDNIYSFNNIIYLIKILDINELINIFIPLFEFIDDEKKNKINNNIKKIQDLSKKQKEKKEKKFKKYKIRLICELLNIYISKYNELKQFQFNVNISEDYSNIEIKNKINLCLKDYFRLDKEVEKKYTKYLELKKEKIKENENKAIYIISPEDIPFKKNIQSDKIKNEINYNSSNMKNICEINDLSFENYEKIQIPFEQENNFDLTLNFYHKLIDEILFLPIILFGIKKVNNKELIDISNYNFNLMCNIFCLYKEENYSLLSDKINEFKKVFLKFCESLKRSGIDFSDYKILKEHLDNLKNSRDNISFIEFKNKEINKNIENVWSDKYSREELLLLQKKKNNKVKNNDKLFEENGQKEDTFFENGNQSDSEEDKIENEEKNKSEKEKEEEINERINELEKNILGERKSETENNPESNDSKNQEYNPKKKGLIKDYKENDIDENKKRNLNENKFEEDIDVTESDGINRCINKLKGMKSNYNIIPNKQEGYLLEKTKKINLKIIPINELYEKSKYLSQYFMYRIIQKLNNYEISLNNKCVSILLDCSVYIKPYKKIINFLILCAMTMVLHSLNIPYSIGLFGDENFKIIIKQYQEKHSILILQQVYECLMMKRYRINLASAFNFAKISKLFINNNLDFYKYYKDRVIYLITDGLDEELSLIKEWKKIIKDNDDISLGLVFNIPDVINKILNQNDKNFDNIYIKNKIDSEEVFLFENDNDSGNVYEDEEEEEEEEKIDDTDLKILLNMWINFEELNKNHNIKTTLINIKNKKIDNYSINQLSINFAELLCKTNNEKNTTYKNKKKNYILESPIITLNNIEFLKNIKFSIIKEDQPYVTQKLIKYENINENDSKPNNYYLSLNKMKGEFLKCKKAIIEEEFNELKKKYFFFKAPNEIIIRKLLENIFIPNKASQKVLSTTGSDIDINAFFLHYLSHDPEPMFYLEEKGGYIRKHSLTIIIDLSKSCLNEFNKVHTLSVIRYLFKYLQFIEISYLDVIISSDKYPIILCSNLNSKIILDKNSDFWISLIYYLCNPAEKTYLSDSIDISYYLNRERNDYNNYIFILTDGICDYEEKKKILSNISRCIQHDIKIFGIGLGFYPINIKELFPYIIYTKNPENIINAIAYFFNRNININQELFKPIINQFPNDLDLEIIKLTNTNGNILTDDRQQLQDKFEISYDMFDNFNDEANIDEMKNTFNAINNPDMQLLKPGSLKGQKILIVMLWSYTLNPSEENKKIVPDYLFESRESMLKNSKINPKYLKKYKQNYNENDICVEKAVKSLGGEIFVVINYKDAINELCKKEKGKCPYYCVWIISGNDKCHLPDEDSDPNLLDQFLELIHNYTMSGGSLVLFGESDPLFFQANLFLEQHEFPTINGNAKTQLRLYGIHEGGQYLTADPSGKLVELKHFNSYRKIMYSNSNRGRSNNPKIKRPSIGFNLKYFYEGETISYAKDENNIFPFTKFAKDSEGGICILFYCGIDGHGDVIVDGGFTKCFLNMEEEGTYQYIQNLAAFTSRIECHFNKVISPKNISFEFKKDYKPSSKFYRSIFVIDSQMHIFNMKEIYNSIKKKFYNGDLIYITNSYNYEITLETLKNMREFNPNFSFDNYIILRKLIETDKNLYKKLYIVDVGEQIKEGYKFSDLILINKDLKKFSITHLSRQYSHYITLDEIKNILKEVNNYITFSNAYIKIRNYLFICGEFFNDEGENGLKLINKKLEDLLSNYYINRRNGLSFLDEKYKILDWRIMCGVDREKLPTAANKNSQ